MITAIKSQVPHNFDRVLNKNLINNWDCKNTRINKNVVAIVPKKKLLQVRFFLIFLKDKKTSIKEAFIQIWMQFLRFLWFFSNLLWCMQMFLFLFLVQISISWTGVSEGKHISSYKSEKQILQVYSSNIWLYGNKRDVFNTLLNIIWWSCFVKIVTDLSSMKTLERRSVSTGIDFDRILRTTLNNVTILKNSARN